MICKRRVFVHYYTALHRVWKRWRVGRQGCAQGQVGFCFIHWTTHNAQRVSEIFSSAVPSQASLGRCDCPGLLPLCSRESRIGSPHPVSHLYQRPCAPAEWMETLVPPLNRSPGLGTVLTLAPAPPGLCGSHAPNSLDSPGPCACIPRGAQEVLPENNTEKHFPDSPS